VPRLCELYPGICLTTEEKARKILSQGRKTSVRVEKTLTRLKNLSQGTKNLSQGRKIIVGVEKTSVRVENPQSR